MLLTIFRRFDIVKATFALTFILMGIYIVYPSIFESTDKIVRVFKVAISASTAIGGVVLIYRSLSGTYRFLTFNEIVSAGVGFLMLAFGFYVMFGTLITHFFSETVKQLLRLLPYVLAILTFIIGIQLIQNKREQGYLLMLIGAVIAGIAFFAQYMKWW